MRLYCFGFLPNYLIFKILLIWKRQRERKGGEREREAHQFCCSTCWCIHSYVPWLGIEPAILEYPDDALTNWATHPGYQSNFKIRIFTRRSMKAFLFSFWISTVMKRLMVRVILKNPVNLPLLFHREESEYQVLLHWLSLVSVFRQSLIPYVQSIKKLHSQTQFQQKRNSHAQTDTEYIKPRNWEKC